MKKLSSVLAIAALLGFGSSVFAEEATAPADDKDKAASATAPATTDAKPADAPAAKEDSED